MCCTQSTSDVFIGKSLCFVMKDIYVIEYTNNVLCSMESLYFVLINDCGVRDVLYMCIDYRQ